MKITVLIFMLICAYSCNPTKKLKKGEYLLEKNTIIDNYSELDEAEIETFIRQKPNRKILKIIQFHLWLYNTIDQSKVAPHKEKRNIRYDRINANRTKNAEDKNRKTDKKNDKIRLENIERDKKGLEPKELKHPKTPKLKDKAKLTWRENIMEAGESPVVLDSFQTKVSKEQIQKFLITKGYFDSRATDSVIKVEFKKILFYKYKKQRAYAYYKISRSTPYHIKNFEYKIDDEQLSYYVFQDTIHSLIKRGTRYDADLLQKERERIVAVQKNNGYFEFSQDYIYFLIDTNLNSHQLNITLGIKNFAYKNVEDSIVKRPHTRFYINKIYIIPDYSMSNKSGYKDSLEYNGVTFLFNEKLKFKKKDLADKIMFHEGEIFVNELAEETYGKITDLRVFKNVNLLFNRTPGTSDRLDCFVQLMPIMKQSFTIETEGTTTSGNLGIAGSIVYQNRNVFRGAELLEIKLRGGLTAQRNLVKDTISSTAESFLSSFNTFQFGPELNLYIPKQLFPFSVFRFNKNASPKTIFNSSVNFQKRPEFSRILSNVTYGFQYRTGQYIRQSIVPLEVSVIKADLSASFEANLKDSKDNFLLNSFTDHMTTVSRYSFTYNNQTSQNPNKRKIFTYLKLDAESSGNILRGIYNLAEQPKDTAGRYLITSIPFSQYLRFNYDYRLYKTIRKLGRVVFRATGGVGKPLHNLRVLPYEKSFFSGGPNSIRAWKARTVGPGSYNSDSEENASFDKIGDAQLEFNLEYRFNIYKFLNGAWFVDAGNIWLRKPDPNKPGGDFKLNRFYKEFATGTGFGLRADFSFFIIRLDAAIKIYDPKYVEGNRFTFDKKPLSTGVINFGIGYPF